MGIKILLGLGLIILEYRAVRHNIGAVWNGYGAVIGTWKRTADAPMRYRVLVPWLIGWLPKRFRLAAYLLAKALCLLFPLFAAYPVIGDGVWVLALLMAATFEFDYWDSYVELGAVCLCLYGSPWWALVGAVLWGMSRETVPLAIPLALMTGGIEAGLAACSGLVVWRLVHLVQGKARLYNEEGRWRLRKERWRDVWHKRKAIGTVGWAIGLMAIAVVNPHTRDDVCLAWKRGDIGVLISVAWTIVAVAVALWGQLPEPLASTAWIGLGWVVASWTLAKARETRTMLPMALWIAGAM